MRTEVRPHWQPIWNLATPDIVGLFDIEVFDIVCLFDIEYSVFDIEISSFDIEVSKNIRYRINFDIEEQNFDIVFRYRRHSTLSIGDYNLRYSSCQTFNIEAQ